MSVLPKGMQEIHRTTMAGLLGRGLDGVESKHAPKSVFHSGTMDIPSPRVSVIGSRNASEGGMLEAGQIVRWLVQNGAIIVSGLARGIDTISHQTVIENGGKTIAVIGTPLNRVYPRENTALQEQLARDHLVVSQYPVGHVTKPRDFVLRNFTMALISDVCVIVEAGDSSGALYHGWESLRLGKPVFICKRNIENDLAWPKKMIQHGAVCLERYEDILEKVPRVTLESF